MVKTVLEFLRKMNKYFHERYYEFYQKFIMEDGQLAAAAERTGTVNGNHKLNSNIEPQKNQH